MPASEKLYEGVARHARSLNHIESQKGIQKVSGKCNWKMFISVQICFENPCLDFPGTFSTNFLETLPSELHWGRVAEQVWIPRLCIPSHPSSCHPGTGKRRPQEHICMAVPSPAPHDGGWTAMWSWSAKDVHVAHRGCAFQQDVSSMNISNSNHRNNLGEGDEGYHLFRGLYQQRTSPVLINAMCCPEQDHWGMRYRVCPQRALNNLHPGRIFYDSAYNLLIGWKSTFTAAVFELMPLISLSLYYVTRIKLTG